MEEVESIQHKKNTVSILSNLSLNKSQNIKYNKNENMTKGIYSKKSPGVIINKELNNIKVENSRIKITTKISETIKEKKTLNKDNYTSFQNTSNMSVNISKIINANTCKNSLTSLGIFNKTLTTIKTMPEKTINLVKASTSYNSTRHNNKLTEAIKNTVNISNPYPRRNLQKKEIKLEFEENIIQNQRLNKKTAMLFGVDTPMRKVPVTTKCATIKKIKYDKMPESSIKRLNKLTSSSEYDSRKQLATVASTNKKNNTTLNLYSKANLLNKRQNSKTDINYINVSVSVNQSISLLKINEGFKKEKEKEKKGKVNNSNLKIKESKESNLKTKNMMFNSNETNNMPTPKSFKKDSSFINDINSSISESLILDRCKSLNNFNYSNNFYIRSPYIIPIVKTNLYEDIEIFDINQNKLLDSKDRQSNSFNENDYMNKSNAISNSQIYLNNSKTSSISNSTTNLGFTNIFIKNSEKPPTYTRKLSEARDLKILNRQNSKNLIVDNYKPVTDKDVSPGLDKLNEKINSIWSNLNIPNGKFRNSQNEKSERKEFSDFKLNFTQSNENVSLLYSDTTKINMQKEHNRLNEKDKSLSPAPLEGEKMINKIRSKVRSEKCSNKI